MSNLLPKYTINLVLIISIVCLIPLSHLNFDVSEEKFFPLSDPDTRFYKEFQEQFQTKMDEEVIFISLENKSAIFDQAFLKKTDELTQYISKLDDISKVYSPTNATIIFFKNNQINARPLIHIQQPEKYKEDSVYLFNSPEYRELLISEKGRSIAVAAFYRKDITLLQKRAVIESVQRTIDSLQFDSSHLVSKVKVEQAAKKVIGKEAILFGVISLVGIFLSVFLLFRSIKPAFFILLLTTISILWTFAIMSLLGYDADAFSAFIPLGLLIASVLNFFQLWSVNFKVSKVGTAENKKRLSDSNQRLILSGSVFVSISILLLYSNNQSIKNLGIFSGIGFTINCILYLVFFASLFNNSFVVRRSLRSFLPKDFLHRVFTLLSKHKPLCMTIAIVMIAICLLPVFKIELNSGINQQLPRRSRITNDYRFIEKKFSGTMPFEMALTVQNKQLSFFEVNLMKQVEEIENYLRDSCLVKRIVSPLSLFKGANKAFNAGEISFYKLPEQRNVFRLYEAIMQTEHAEEMTHYMLENGTRIRISGSMHEISKRDFKKQVQKFNVFFRQKGFAPTFSYTMTGPVVLLNRIVDDTSKSLWFELAMGSVFLLFASFYITRRLSSALISLLFPGLPLTIVFSIVGLFNIDVGLTALPLFFILFIGGAGLSFQILNDFQFKAFDNSTVNVDIKTIYINIIRRLIQIGLVLLPSLIILLFSQFMFLFYIGLLLVIHFVALVLSCLFIFPFLKKLEARVELNQLIA